VHRIRLTVTALIVTASAAWIADRPTRVGRDGPPGYAEWTSYGGDAGGTRYAGLAQITPDNVERLRVAWIFHTGDSRRGEVFRDTAFAATPILVEDSLVFCTPFNEVIALDPGTGRPRWRHDPQVRTDLRPGNHYTCRGVAYWRDPLAESGSVCASRIFEGTTDGRLIALDARSGRPCDAFGRNRQVRVLNDQGRVWPGEVQITSPPVVARERVIVGSSISDAWRADAPRGTVRAFDARTGRMVWSFDPITEMPHGGAANVWAPMSVDEKRGLIFLATSSPSPDFYGGLRPGDNRDADSVIALDASTGRKVWSYQTVHHDVWDYDLPAQPSLVTIKRDGHDVDAVVQVTKTGFVFVLDRENGQPLFPITEQSVPQGGVPGERLSPTQPVPLIPAPLVPQRLTSDMAWGLTPWDQAKCRDRIAASRSEGLFTPPSLQGTIVFPFNGGGSNWGGAAVDPTTQTLFVNTSRAAHLVTLVPASRWRDDAAPDPKVEVRPQRGTPYSVRRELLVSPLGLPCNPPPWGMLAAIDLHSGVMRWQSVLGTVRDLAPVPLPLKFGTPNLGGPVATAGGVLFIAAAMDDYLRAFDQHTGAELWKGRLPAGGQATPITYAWRGRQYVAIAAGGSARMGTRLGDSLVAYAL
jgi:quinoprotein glucose dehydrogenase